MTNRASNISLQRTKSVDFDGFRDFDGVGDFDGVVSF